MAKRAASKDGVVISQEIQALVRENNAIRGPEVMAALRAKYPKMTFNENSCQVAYANARKKLGIARTVVKRPVGSSGPIGKATNKYSMSAGSKGAASETTAILYAAKSLLQACNGDEAAAQAALKTVASLQMH